VLASSERLSAGTMERPFLPPLGVKRAYGRNDVAPHKEHHTGSLLGDLSSA
jgi:hypothetical protein